MQKLDIPGFERESIMLGEVGIVYPDYGVSHDPGHPLGGQVFLVGDLKPVQDLLGGRQTHLDRDGNCLHKRTPKVDTSFNIILIFGW